MILVEGIPGSGKTTTAELACSILRERGVEASWYDELEARHPATPRSLRKRHADVDFAEQCLASWHAYVVTRRPHDSIHILESSTFQDTVRFMYADDRSEDEVRTYVDSFVQVVDPLAPLFVYLSARDARSHLRDFVLPIRGREWVGKLCAYVEGTPVARRLGWSGEEGMIEFWLRYRALCDELVDDMKLSVLRLEFADADWSDARIRLERVLTRGLGAAGTPLLESARAKS